MSEARETPKPADVAGRGARWACWANTLCLCGRPITTGTWNEFGEHPTKFWKHIGSRWSGEKQPAKTGAQQGLAQLPKIGAKEKP